MNPPGVLAARPIVVIATAHPIHGGGIQHVAVLIEHRAVVAAVHGNLAVTMELPAQDLQIARCGLNPVSTHSSNSVALHFVPCIRLG